MLPEDVLFIIDRLNDNGYEAFAVGGCVRDRLLEQEPNDWDIATSALPEKTAEIFSEFFLVKNGIKHGTVGVVLNRQMYEITTYRTDGEYSDMRRPDNVRFIGELEADLARRDFTVNAMAMDKNENIIDVFGGRKDLENKIIRCVGDAQKRFNEDALRIMRALRFASYDGFSIEENTLFWANTLSENLKTIAYERIYAELKKMLIHSGSGNIMLKTYNVFKSIFPSLNAQTKRWAEICASVTRCEGSFDAALACILLHTDIDLELHRLKAETATKKKLKKLYEMTDIPIKSDVKYLRRLMSVHTKESVEFLCFYKVCIGKAEKGIIQKAREAASGCSSISELEVNGNDIKNLGIKNYMIRQTLEKLLDAVINEKCENNKDALIEYAAKIKKTQR